MDATPPTALSPDERKQLITLFNGRHYVELEQRAHALLEANLQCGFAWQILGAALEMQGKNGLHALTMAAQLLPDDPGAHSNLANALRDHGQFDEAVASYRRALTRNPDFAVAHCGLGFTLRRLGKLDDAIACYRRALALKPDYPEACNNLGNALHDLGQLDEAIANYQRALRFNPDFADAYGNMGNALRENSRHHEAVECFRRAVQLKPDSADAYCSLGNALHEVGRHVEALENYRRASQIDPGSAATQTNLGNALAEIGHDEEAMTCYRKALQIDPDFAMARKNLGNSQHALGQFDEAQASYRQALAIDPSFAGAYSSLLFALSHNINVDAENLFAEHCRFGEHFESPLRADWRPHGNDRDPERQLQIGFVSGDLRDHPVAFFVEPVLTHLAGRQQLALHVYHNHSGEDPVTKRIRGLVKHWNPVSGLSDEALAQKIRADGIDILIDLSGHTGYVRLLTFARKPAPLQASWIGYPGTTGLRAMDYYLADRFFLPLDQFAGQFTEQIAYLPANAPFQPFSGAPAVTSLPASTNGYLTFGSFNRISKITRPVVTLWSQLLRALPNSRMLVGGMPHEDQCETLLIWFAQEGVARERVELYRRSDMGAYLKLHHRVDLCLDTFPYTGGTTTCHAAWMGVPTLTLVGNTPCGQQGAAILGHLGLETFIARDAQDFMHKGVVWAQQFDTLSAIRSQLRERLTHSVLGQPALVADGLERALRTMWRRWCSGLPAVHF